MRYQLRPTAEPADRSPGSPTELTEGAAEERGNTSAPEEFLELIGKRGLVRQPFPDPIERSRPLNNVRRYFE